MELLAPAGNLKCFEAAIVNGANAIYLGLDGFNARMKADNFGVDALRENIRRAHFYGVKVYVTVNTIVTNDEFKPLLELVKQAIDAKADAFIVQDIGVARALREAFDDVELHASTQLGVHNLYGAKIAEEAGFRRVVLSRETSMDDIREIKNGTALEIECFVHGALCVAFSGNCYLSATEMGASGNRGVCKQMCRMQYDACQNGRTVGEGYLLSAKDLCLANSVKQLYAAGVDSLKIEGRMRREEYVAETVKTYRRIIDAVDGDDFKDAELTEIERERLKVAFCRGDFSERGYLDGGNPPIIEKKFNNHTGIYIGKVAATTPFKKELVEVVVETDRKLHSGDGLKFFKRGEEVASLGVGEARDAGKNKIGIVTNKEVPVGAEVRLISDAGRTAELEAQKRYIDIDMTVSALAGEPLGITAQCEAVADGYRQDFAAACWTDEILEKARTAPMSEAELRAQTVKTAESGFRAVNCDVATNGVFVAKSVLNRIRRTVLSELAEKLIAASETHAVKFKARAYENIIEKEYGEGAEPVCELKIVREGDMTLEPWQTAVISPEKYDAGSIRALIASVGKTEEDVMLLLPNVATGSEVRMIAEELKKLPALNTLVSENIFGMYFASMGYTVIAGAGHNIANDLAAKEVVDMGARGVVPSAEYKDGISEDADVDVFALEGDMPLMTFVHCPYKTVYGGDCASCKYQNGLEFKRAEKTYEIRRRRLKRCYFGMYPKK